MASVTGLHAETGSVFRHDDGAVLKWLQRAAVDVCELLLSSWKSHSKTWNSHLHVGADELQKPSGWHSLIALPTSECSFGHLYSIVDPTVKFLPTTVVLTLTSGDPHESGACWQTK